MIVVVLAWNATSHFQSAMLLADSAALVVPRGFSLRHDPWLAAMTSRALETMIDRQKEESS